MTAWDRIRVHLRVARRFVVQAMVRETHYRVHFLTTIGVGMVELFLALLPIWLLFGYTDDLNGWSQAKVIALVGLFQLTMGVLAAVVGPNLTRMTDYISKGELDTVLIRPVNGQFYLTFRWFQPAELGKVLTGLAVLVVGLVRAGTVPGPLEVLQAALLVLAGLVLITCAWSALVYLAFWVQSVGPVSEVFLEVTRAGQYPLPIFPPVVRAFFTFAVPMGFATTFPAQALAGELGWEVVLGGLGLAAVAVALIRAYWGFGLRFYSSASS
ncbi:ABC transporter permease [Flindersiella endophytica]